MAKQIEQTLAWCENCNKKTLHYKETRKINWVMHICLLFVGIGFITLPLALFGRAMTADIGGGRKGSCSQCGYDN